jgi:hypothetical protein
MALGLAWPAGAGPLEDQEAQIEEILRLVDEGVSDDVIVKHIRASGYVFDLLADDILDLRDRGVSDVVIEAMLDTALENTDPADRRERPRDRDRQSHVDVVLSAGYFSPWYYYPYAWGYYYDPFPVYYSYYYYPFRYGWSWGWYGSCHNYWYRHHWRRYRWDDPAWYPVARHASWVRVPRSGRQWSATRTPRADRNTTPPARWRVPERRAVPADGPRAAALERRRFREGVGAGRTSPPVPRTARERSPRWQPTQRAAEPARRYSTPPAAPPPRNRQLDAPRLGSGPARLSPPAPRSGSAAPRSAPPAPASSAPPKGNLGSRSRIGR